MQTLVVCIYFLFYLTQNYLLQQALNAGGVACHAATTGCALTSPPIPKHSTILLQGATHLCAISVSCVMLSSQMSGMLIISMPHVVFLDTVCRAPLLPYIAVNHCSALHWRLAVPWIVIPPHVIVVANVLSCFWYTCLLALILVLVGTHFYI